MPGDIILKKEWSKKVNSFVKLENKKLSLLVFMQTNYLLKKNMIQLLTIMLDQTRPLKRSH